MAQNLGKQLLSMAKIDLGAIPAGTSEEKKQRSSSGSSSVDLSKYINLGDIDKLDGGQQLLGNIVKGVGGGFFGSRTDTMKNTGGILSGNVSVEGLSEHDYEVITKAVQDPQLFFKQQAQKILDEKLDKILDVRIAEKVAGLDFGTLAEKQQKVRDIIRGFKYGIFENEDALDVLRDRVADEIVKRSEAMMQREIGKVTGAVRNKVDSVFGQVNNTISDVTGALDKVRDFDIQASVRDTLSNGIDDALSGINGALSDIGLGSIDSEIFTDAVMNSLKDSITPIADENLKLIEDVSEQVQEYIEMIEDFEDMVQDFIDDIERQAMDWLKEQEKALVQHILSCVNISIGDIGGLAEIGSFSFGF